MFAWQSQVPIAASIYTCRKNTEGKIAFICCLPADINRDGIFEGSKEELVAKGEIYTVESEEDIIEIIEAFEGKSSFNYVPIHDKWGLWVTATEPILDKNNEIDAVLGVDFWGKDWNEHIWHAVFWPRVSLLTFLLCFVVVQLFMIRQKNIEDRLIEYTANLERITDELAAAKKNAEIAAEAKSFFLANMSHEIRTPMTAILGCVDMLISIKDGRAMRLSQEQLISILQKSSRNLMTIIDDVLTFASIDTNRIVLESVPVDLRQLVEDVKIILSSRLEEKPHLTFRTEWDDSVPQVITGDPTRIRQILLNLVNNAIKFTEFGHVIVRCSIVQPSEQAKHKEPIADKIEDDVQIIPLLDPHIAATKGLRGKVHMVEQLQSSAALQQLSGIQQKKPNTLTLRIDVSDTGVGIAREHFASLFKPFAQVDETSTRKFGGTGLGLSIVDRLVKLMDGKVFIESKPGYGSTFSILIPVSKCDAAVTQQGKTSSSPPSLQIRSQYQESSNVMLMLSEYNILVVDDVMVNRMVLESRLREMGAKVQSASNGQIAVDMVSESEKTKTPFDFILMDLQMPVMDGFEATQAIRQQGFIKPIVALTANKDSNQLAMDSGCNSILQKPVDREVLVDTIIRLTQKTRPIGSI